MIVVIFSISSVWCWLCMYCVSVFPGLLSVPPGFKEGMTFGEAEKKPAVGL